MKHEGDHPFATEIHIKGATGLRLRWSGEIERANQTLTLNLAQFTSATDYEIELTLDGNRAYLGRFVARQADILNSPLL